MADAIDEENDDSWLYGDNQEANPAANASEEPQPEDFTQDPQIQETAEPLQPPLDDGPPGVDDIQNTENKTTEDVDNEAEDGELRQNGDDSDKEDLDDDSDDDVNVVIGDIKTTPSYTQLNIKRGGLTTTIGDKGKQVQQTGKFAVEEFEQIGTINGVPATEYNLDSLEDKPWRKPGADITDYFNYGFNEDTWKAYCERQKRLRVNESGVGIIPLNAIGLPNRPMQLMNDNSKYNPNFIGGMNQRPMMQPPIKTNEPPKMNTIQVMTADRREYSRKPAGFPDLTVPPPAAFEEFQPEYGFNPEPEPFYGGYEPTQDSQWAEANPNWAPTEIKTLTGAPPPHMGPPPHIMGPPPMGMAGPPMHSPSRRDGSPSRERDRERDKDREPSRSKSEKPRDHDRERERSERPRRRDRSRSRSRRHRSRSKSPSHRSHKKKKSRRHEDSE